MSRGSRALWTVVGLVLTAAGVLGVLASAGWLPGTNRDTPLLSTRVRDGWQDLGDWGLVLVVAAGLLLALLGFLLLRSTLRRGAGRRLRDLVWRSTPQPVPEDETVPPPAAPERAPARPAGGRSRVGGGTLSRALRSDLRAVPGIDRADVRLTGTRQAPGLALRLAVAPETDLADLHRQVDQALARFAATSGVAPRVDDLVLRFTNRRPSRVS